jgi:hypothetical protein
MIRFIAVVAALISVIGTIQVASAEYLAKCHGPGNCTHQSCRQNSFDASQACIDACPGGQVDSVVQTDCFGRPSKSE